MNIGIDVDGVLARFDDHFSSLLIHVSGRDLFPTKPYDPPCWDWCEPLGYTKEEEAATWEQLKKMPTFWENLPAYKESWDVLDYLSQRDQQGDSVYFITNRMGINPKRQTNRWLMKNGYYSIPSVLVSSHKGVSAAALDLDVYIDDKPSNCEDVLRYRGIKTKVYLMDRSWNQNFKGGYIKRVNSIGEMFDAPVVASTGS